jgi:hypothetical protein
MRAPEFERERYELLEGPRYLFEVDRRDFVKTFSTGYLFSAAFAPSAFLVLS